MIFFHHSIQTQLRHFIQPIELGPEFNPVYLNLGFGSFDCHHSVVPFNKQIYVTTHLTWKHLAFRSHKISGVTFKAYYFGVAANGVHWIKLDSIGLAEAK